MRALKLLTYYLLGIIGIICISVLPQVFATKGITDVFGYFQSLGSFLTKLPNPEEWVYRTRDSLVAFPIFEVIWEPYIYSMMIFGGAIILGFFLAFVLAFSSNLLPHKRLGGLKRVLDFLESIPDLVIAILLQILSVYVFKAFGVDLFRVAGFAGEKVFFAPIVTLAILPTVSLFKILLLMIEEEMLKEYVGFLKSKGIKEFGILIRHVFRNVLPTTFQHSKVIIWATLSSQFVIERIFNVHGLTSLIAESLTPMTIAVTLLLLYTPFFLLFQVVDLWLVDDPIKGEQLFTSEKYSFRPLHTITNFIYSIAHIHWREIKPWRPFVTVFKVIINHLKNYKIAIGSLFFIGMISVSLFYSITTDNHVEKEYIIYEADGLTLKSTPPHAPGEPFILGSNNEGVDLLDALVIGAKYTLVFALLIAVLRGFIGMLGGILYAFLLKSRQQEWTERLVDSIHFLPLSVIAYALLAPILIEGVSGFAYSLQIFRTRKPAPLGVG
ncbi:ABC transporter permease subunit [Virgibacillus sp. DJP39]|uniref:ABC transporter permease subunit n=1 Tax=Virgibacillus sp. DJP39 TaxID=3409790 RepID=UPI003BB61E56